MLKTLVLVCAAALDRSACTPDTAIDVVRALPTKNVVMCGLDAQSIMARTSIAPEPGKQYIKIICVRDQATVARSK